MKDPIRRAIRTLLVLLVTASGAIPALAAVFNLPAGRVAQVVGVFTFVGTMLTALLNHLEDTTSMPAILKAPPSSGENPVPDPGPRRDARGRFVGQNGVSDLAVMVVVVAAVLVLFVLVSTGRI